MFSLPALITKPGNIITKRPVNKTSGFAGIDIGNYGQQRYSLGFNTPLIKNKLFVNIGLQSNKRGAIFENPTINTEAFDSRQAYNGNLGLKYLLNNHWSIDLNARIENNTDKGGYPWVATDSIARNEPFKTFGNCDNTEKRRNTNVSMAAKYFGQNFNFTSITSVIDFDSWFPGRFDFDFTALKLISGQVRTEQNQITQEFRISSPASDRTFRWTVGSFLFSEKAQNITSTFYEEDFAFFDPSAPYSTITNGKRDNKGLAFFGQGSYSIASNLDITIGARYDTEQRNLTQNSDILNLAVQHVAQFFYAHNLSSNSLEVLPCIAHLRFPQAQVPSHTAHKLDFIEALGSGKGAEHLPRYALYFQKEMHKRSHIIVTPNLHRK